MSSICGSNKNGKTLVSTDVVTGDISKGHGTPTGVYYILYKTTDYTLTGQGYASHVDYWLPFIQIGVGSMIHPGVEVMVEESSHTMVLTAV